MNLVGQGLCLVVMLRWCRHSYPPPWAAGMVTQVPGHTGLTVIGEAPGEVGTATMEVHLV
jgi:hypothetical protein